MAEEGDDLAKATVRIDPDLSYFKDMLREKLAEATDDESAEIKVKPVLDHADLQKALADTNASMQELGDKTLNIKPEVDKADADAALGEVDAEAKKLGTEKPKITPTIDRSQFVTGIAEVDASLQELGHDVPIKLKPQLDLAAVASAKVEEEALQHELEQSADRTEKLGEAEDALRGKTEEVSTTFRDRLSPALGGVGDKITVYLSQLQQMKVAQGEINDITSRFKDGALSAADGMRELTDRGMTEDQAAKTLFTDLDKGTKSLEGWAKVLDGLKTAGGGLETVFRGVFNTVTGGAGDIERASQVVTGALTDISDGVQDVEIGAQFFEQLGIDAEQGAQLVEQAGEDIEGALQIVEKATESAMGGMSGFSSILSGLGESGAGAVAELGPMVGIVALITAAVLAALPIVGALVGVVGALASAGFVGLAGVGAVVLGLSGDFGKLKDAATSALTEYRAALKPFTEPIVDAVTPMISKGLRDLIPIGQKAAGAVESVVKEANQAMDAPGFTKFIGWITSNADPAIRTFSSFLGNIGSGLASAGEQMQPFTNMVEHGLDSLGQRFAAFGASNSFKTFVEWLQTNGPTVGRDIEEIGKDVISIGANLTPVGLKLLNMFTSVANGIEEVIHYARDVIDPIVKVKDTIDGITSKVDSFGDGFGKFLDPLHYLKDMVDPLAGIQDGIGTVKSLIGLFSSGSAPVHDFATGIDHLATSSMADLHSGAEKIQGDMAALQKAFNDGKIGQSDYSSQMDTLDKALKKNSDETKTFNSNLDELQTKFGLSRQGAISMANSLGVNLSTALKPDELKQFTDALDKQASQAGVTAYALANLAKVGHESLSQVTTDVQNATSATKTAWSSYGDAITAFSNQTSVSGDDIKKFYYEQTVQAGQFVTNVQSAIKAGYSPQLISQVLQAGPGQASTFLQALVSNEGSGLQALSQNALNTMSSLGAQAVEQSRITQMAVEAHTDKMAGDLTEAMGIDQAKTTPDPTASLAALTSQYAGGLKGLQAVAKEYGITLPKALTDAIPATTTAAGAQADAANKALGSKAPAASKAGQSQLAAFYQAILANQSGVETAGMQTASKLLSGLGDTTKAKDAGKKQGDAVGDGATSSTKPKDAATKVSKTITDALGDPKQAGAAGEKVIDAYAKSLTGDMGPIKQAGDKITTALTASFTGEGSKLNDAARTAARGAMDTIVNVLQSNLGSVTSTSNRVAMALPTAINSEIGATKSAAQDLLDGFFSQVDSSASKAEDDGKKMSEALRSGVISIDLGEAGKTLLTKLTSSLENTGPMRSAGVSMANAAADGVKSGIGEFQTLGVQALQGFASGLANSGALAQVKAAAVNAVNQAVKAGSGPAGLNSGSPSRRTHDELGIPYLQGFMGGLADSGALSQLTAAAQRSVSTAVTAGRTTIASNPLGGLVAGTTTAGAGAGAGGAPITYSPSYTIQGAPDASSVALWKQLTAQHDAELLHRAQGR